MRSFLVGINVILVTSILAIVIYRWGICPRMSSLALCRSSKPYELRIEAEDDYYLYDRTIVIRPDGQRHVTYHDWPFWQKIRIRDRNTGHRPEVTWIQGPAIRWVVPALALVGAFCTIAVAVHSLLHDRPRALRRASVRARRRSPPG